MSYDRSKLEPGYTGKFVIQSHDADEAGKHWDLRLEFPVESLDSSLSKYEDKRNPETSEPWGDFKDKPGSVYRSMVTKKMKFPTKEDKIYLIETEDHPISYGKFEGTIPKGQYGSGEVDIYDKGTFELLERDGDKKYVIDFKGDKLSGTYALVKYKKGFLWVKAAEKKASVIDYTRPTLSPQIWDLEEDPPIIRESVRKEILGNLMGGLIDHGFEKPWSWIRSIVLEGSIVTYNYNETSDVDVTIDFDLKKMKKVIPDLGDLPTDSIRDLLKRAVSKYSEREISGTTHPVTYVFLAGGDLDSDAEYDLLSNKWNEKPKKVPMTFDPDKALSEQKNKAARIAIIIDWVVGEIVRIAHDMEVMNQYSRHYPNSRINAKRVMAMSRLRRWCEELDSIHYQIRDIWNRRYSEDPENLRFPAYTYSSNWEEGVIIFKYLQRWGYHLPVAILYNRLKGHPMLEVIDNIIPDD